MRKPIVTAGTIMNKLDEKYTLDALRNLNNPKHFNDYVIKFEKAFARYVGIKYAMTTSGGTWAFLLACEALGIGKGDEVIFPDIAYFSVVDVVVQLGAKPVFVDVLKSTWCIDPNKIEEKITLKTKAIVPVYTYGNFPEMKKILKVAQKHNLKVIEDACPAVGCRYEGKHAGTFGDFGCFSFQGAKILTTGGLGGMIVTNNKKLFERAKYLNRQGESYTKKFWQTEHGYCFELTNVQAAIGLAQLKRIKHFIKKKRQIFNWYYKKLNKIEGISFNYEQKGVKTNRWMPSIVLNKFFSNNFKLSRNELMTKLKAKGIDTRPFFYPVSSFPMYRKANNPVALHLASHGINLPGAVYLNKKEIDYVSNCILEILNES